jgi:cardiolipin synthase A/B
VIWTVEYLWPFVLAAVNIAAASAATVHAVLYKRETKSVIAWVGLVWLSPLFGALLYFCFGINRLERKAVSLRLRTDWRHPRQATLIDQDLAEQNELIARHPSLSELAQLVERLTEHPLFPGNRVQPLCDGDETYPAMLEAIDRAERSVSLASYIFDNDRAGEAFLDRLVQARQRGVEVRVLIDDVGGSYSRPTMLRRLRQAGLNAQAFLPTRVPRLFKYANLRNHRKLLVVDGRVGFTGGTNIREGHWLGLEPESPVQCVHFRFEGPVVAHLQEAFGMDWAFAADELLEGEAWFPKLARAGDVWARGVPDGPDEDLDKMPLTILGALTAARRSVHVVTPYFLPDLSILQALSVAALRGVQVHIVLPSRNNIPLVQWATAATLPEILGRGCRVYSSPPPFDHTKLLLIDDLWALVGSTNWDARSLRLNFEFNVECYSAALVSQLHALVDRKIVVSEELTLEQLENRHLAARLRDGTARLLSPYL